MYDRLEWKQQVDLIKMELIRAANDIFRAYQPVVVTEVETWADDSLFRRQQALIRWHIA